MSVYLFDVIENRKGEQNEDNWQIYKYEGK